MIKRKIAGLILGCLLMAGVAEARNNAALFGAAALITGAAIVANSQSEPPPEYYDEPRQYHKKAKKRQATVVTSEMKIQQSLTNMGLYQGKIDGKLNTYVSRTAIKNLNTQYGIAEGSSLDPRTRDQLLYLADLYQMDKDLFAEGNNKRVAGKRIQTALRVHGVYFDQIDGIVGNGTRKAIAAYKIQQGLTPSISLSPSETEELIRSAQELNTKAIDEAIRDLSPRQQTTQVPRATQQDTQNQNDPEELQSAYPSQSNEDATQDMPASSSGEEQNISPSSSSSEGMPNQGQDTPAAPGFE